MEILFQNPNTGINENVLYQWDQKVPMSVQLSNATVVEAVFNAVGMKQGIRRTLTKGSGTTWSCTVPDLALTYGTDVSIFFTYVSSGRRTVDVATVNVVKQLKPEGYVSTEDPEYITFSQLLNMVNEARKELFYYGPDPVPKNIKLRLKDGREVDVPTMEEEFNPLLKRVDAIDDDLTSFLGNIKHYNSDAIARYVEIQVPVKKGDYVLFNVEEWTGSSFDYVFLYGYKDGQTSGKTIAYSNRLNNIVIQRCNDDYSFMRVFVNTASAPTQKVVLKSIVGVFPADSKYLSTIVFQTDENMQKIMRDISNISQDNYNLIHIYDSTKEASGTKREYNEMNGTVTITGTSSSNQSLALKDENDQDIVITLKANTTYTLSGCPSGANGYWFDIRKIGVGTVWQKDDGNGITFETDADGAEVTPYIRIASGTKMSNVIIRPMLCEGVAKPFVPYVHKSANDFMLEEKVKTMLEPIYQDEGVWLMYNHVNASDATNKFQNKSSLLPVNTYSYINTDWFTDLNAPVSGIYYLERKGGWRDKAILFAIVETLTNAVSMYQRFYTPSTGVYTQWVELHNTRITGHYFAFGDSLTYGVLNGKYAVDPPSQYTYPKSVGLASKMEVHNMAIPGSGFFAHSYSTGDRPKAIDTVKSVSLSNADLISIALGTNDSDKPLGTANDASGAETICGKLIEILEYITDTKPNAQVVLIAPPRTSVGFDYVKASGWSTNMLIDEFKKIGAKYCFPVLDYKDWSCSSDKVWFKYTTTGDRVHPDEYAYKKMASFMSAKILNCFNPLV